MQQNECRDRQLLLMEPVLEPGRNFSVVQTHAVLRSKLLPTSIVLHCEGGCTGLVVLAQGSWSYFRAQTCLLSSPNMNSWRKKSSGAPFHEVSLFVLARKKIARMQKCGKKSFTTKIQVKQWLKLFCFLQWIIIKC